MYVSESLTMYSVQYLVGTGTLPGHGRIMMLLVVYCSCIYLPSYFNQ